MPESRCHSLDRPGGRNSASGHSAKRPISQRVARNKPVPAPFAAQAAGSLRSISSTRQPAVILAGLPAHVMDELVDDLAEAVVAMLLSQAAMEPGEDDDEGSNLRQVQL